MQRTMGDLDIPFSATPWMRAAAHLRLMRPYAWLWFDALPVLALSLILGARVEMAGLCVLLCILLDSAATTLNDVCDLKSDQLSTETSRNQRPLVTGIISKRAALIQVAVLIVAALLLSVWISTSLFWATVIILALAMAYSAPPFRLNARPTTSHVFWFFCGTSFYFLVLTASKVEANFSSQLWLAGFFAYFATGENFAKDLRDIENDQAAGKRTLITQLGPRLSARVSLAGGILGSLVFLALSWQNAAIELPGRLLISLLLAHAVWSIYGICRAIERQYSKDLARRLHRTYIAHYLAFHLLLVGSLLF